MGLPPDVRQAFARLFICKEGSEDLWKDKRKKAWRRIRTGGERLIRRLCLAALILEAAWGMKGYIQTVISQKYEVVGQWEEDQADPGPGKSIFGITIELEDGMIRIYREEERWE